MAGYYDPDGFWVNTDDSGNPTGYIADPLNEQKGAGSGAGTDVVTDPSGVTVATPGGTDIGGLLGPYKKLFEKITSGTAGANDYAAALGILGLLLPSLNKPQTGGWKGSIDLGKQLNRTPIAQPAYQPYAQSQAPVMGRQFFTSTYGSAPAAGESPPAASGAALPATGSTTTSPATDSAVSAGTLPELTMDDPYVNPDLHAPGAAQGGLMGLAGGGRAMPPRYLQGETDGMEDKVPSSIDDVQPAKLSHGEFVIPADVVSHLGNGNSDAGAKVLYGMMDRVRKARTGTKKQGKQINPEKFTPGGIAGYAGGGAVAFQTGGTTGTTAPLGASTETNISSWAGPYVGDMLSKTSALTSTPYQAYQGPLVAGTSPLQAQAFQGLSELGTPSQFGAATQLATQAGQQAGALNYTPSAAPAFDKITSGFQAPGAYQAGVFNTGLGQLGSVSDYMSPYMSGVTDIASREARRQADISRQAEQGRLAQAGAYGGSRQAIMEAERQRNLGQQIGDIQEKGLQSAYDRAMQQRMQEAGLGLEAQKAGEASRQFGAQQGMTGAQQTAQFGMAAQQANQQAAMEAQRMAEQSRQFGAGYGMQGIGQQLAAAGQLGSLGSQQFGTQLQGLSSLLGAGQQQRGIEQEGISGLQRQYETELIDPYTKLRFQKEMLSGLPVQTASTTANTSTANQLSGQFANIEAMMKALGLTN